VVHPNGNYGRSCWRRRAVATLMLCWSGAWIGGGLAGDSQELQHLGGGLVSLTEALDLTTPGPAMGVILAVLAEFEREILRKHAGLAHAQQNGKKTGSAH
jgi:hypothetical protein